jgi:hypothetical protein
MLRKWSIPIPLRLVQELQDKSTMLEVVLGLQGN